MKLVFPKGEHPQVLLSPGINGIGAAAGSTVMLHAPSMPALAAEIHVIGANTNLIPCAGAEILVNDKPVSELIALRAGDRLRIAGVEARLAAIAAALGTSATPAEQLEDPATRMIMAVPKYSLRGLNGSDFNKLYHVSRPMIIGRAPESDITLNSPEISRRHAQLRPSLDGVFVEDLGSSNGIWINNARVPRGMLRPGDELRLDTTRFVLTAPGTDLATAPRRIPPPAAKPGKTMSRPVIALVTFGALLVTMVLVLAVR